MGSAARRSVFLLLALGLGGMLGADCGPAAAPPVRVPTLVDERGAVEPDAFESLVEAIEASRGLAFTRRPELVTVPAEDPELARLALELDAFAPIPGATAPAHAAAPDLAASRVVATAPPDSAAVAEALARILDEQHYPRLVALAPALPGDGGVALRALLQASATATTTGSWPTGDARIEPYELLRSPVVTVHAEGKQRLEPAQVATFAGILLLQLDDREEAFRRPPLSTKQLLSRGAYEGSDRPLLLVGPPPAPAGCKIAGDESVGVVVLLLGAAARGIPVSGPALAAWKGDRLVRYACDDGSMPWIYVVQLEREDAVAGFGALLPATLPVDPAAPEGQVASAGRLVAWRGVDAAAAKAFAAALEAREVRDPGHFLP